MSGVAGAQGMTGADKSVIVADLLAQFIFRRRTINSSGVMQDVLPQLPPSRFADPLCRRFCHPSA
jgi:hypothetical protein